MRADNDSPAKAEISISYSAVFCSHKDLVLLGSILSLYGTQGHAVWRRGPLPDAEVVIIGSEARTSESAALLQSGTRPEQAVLYLGDLPLPPGSRSVFQCKPPLRALHLAGKLKQIEALVRQRAHPRPDTGPIMLARWPSPAFFSGNADFMRMCTMLSVRHMTLDELTTQSGFPRERCQEFLDALYHAGLAEAAEPEEEAPRAAPPKGGLRSLAGRIRAALGFAMS